MSFFAQADYSLNKFFMSATGLWPYQSMTWRIFICLFCTFMNITMILTMFIGILTCDELDDKIKLIAPMLTGVASGARFFNCLLNSNRMKHLLEQVKSDWSLLTDTEYFILKQFSRRGRNLTIIYEVYLYCNLVVYFVNGASPKLLNIVRPLNETRPLIRTYRSNYFLNEENYYFHMLLHEYIASFINITTMLSVDTMYAVLTEHVCGMFTILRHRLENIIQNNKCNLEIEDSLEEKDRIVNVTMNCITLHQRNIEFANTLDDAFSNSLLLQISINIVSLSITGYMIILKLDKLDECMLFCSFTLTLLILMLYSCIPGEKLQNYSIDAVNSVFDSLWYNMSVKNQKQLMLMMVRSGRSCKLQAGKLFVLSLEFYTSCIQTSFSYLTMLLTMRKNGQ
ncbi:odorant receptor 9a-like [Leptopilina heterotoma]|uniref:odorant receptor 9a-like n=1 Tax=Leptopilina heterotoma TaxID=63436 RepID=UPI001CA85C34|nr:odorant receptor 9a-like [Leptopilina heterotoma]